MLATTLKWSFRLHMFNRVYIHDLYSTITFILWRHLELAFFCRETGGSNADA